MTNEVHFSTRDSKYQITLRSGSLELMLKQCMRSSHMETGGVLIGYYSDSLDDAIITQISHEPDDSVKSRYSFVRGIKGLFDLLKSLWSSRRYYLGEWHFHPYSSPSPSGDDIAALKEIAKNAKYNCKTPLMVILGGDPAKTYKLRVFVCADEEVIELNEF